MGKTNPQATITISLADLEALIRRVVQEAVREEFMRLLRKARPSILEDQAQEGPEDPQGDEELLAEALVMSRQYRDAPEGWKDWEDFKAELKAAEAAGELPHLVG